MHRNALIALAAVTLTAVGCDDSKPTAPDTTPAAAVTKSGPESGPKSRTKTAIPTKAQSTQAVD